MPGRTLYKTAEYEVIYLPNRTRDRDPDTVYGGTIVRLEGSDDEIQEFIDVPRAEALAILTRYLQEQLGREPQEPDFLEFERLHQLRPTPTASPVGNKRARAPFPPDSRDFLGSDSD